MNTREKLKAAIELEGDADITACGHGKYTREVAEPLRAQVPLGPAYRDETDDEDGYSVMAYWAYGPQGHPASLHMTLYVDDTTTQLWEHGPLILRRYEVHTSDFAVHMDRIHALGARIEKRFCHDPYWHCCKSGCQGYDYNSGPLYRKCVACDKRQLDVERESYDFLKDAAQ